MIRSLNRGLDILVLLNAHGSATASALAKELKAPRATVYRILETLLAKGFIYQHDSDGRFRVTQKVHSLSYGFTDQRLIASLSKDLMEKMTEQLVWPISLATISGVDLIVRENTDKSSPLAVEKFAIDHRMPVLATASGICILAFMDSKTRNIILNMLLQINREQDQLVHNKSKLGQQLQEIRAQGYAIHHRSKDRVDITAVAVPIHAESQVCGALTLRYTEPALSLDDVTNVIVPTLTAAAKELSERLSAHLRKKVEVL